MENDESIFSLTDQNQKQQQQQQQDKQKITYINQFIDSKKSEVNIRIRDNFYVYIEKSIFNC